METLRIHRIILFVLLASTLIACSDIDSVRPFEGEQAKMLTQKLYGIKNTSKDT